MEKINYSKYINAKVEVGKRRNMKTGKEHNRLYVYAEIESTGELVLLVDLYYNDMIRHKIETIIELEKEIKERS